MEHLEALLHSSQAKASPLAYIRTLATAFEATKTLIDQLSAMTHYRGGMLSSHLMEDIFASFLENNRFEEAEGKCLQKLLHVMATDYTSFWQTKKVQRRTNPSLTSSAVGVATSMVTSSFLSAATAAQQQQSQQQNQSTASSSMMMGMFGQTDASISSHHFLISSDLTISFLDALEESERRIRLISAPERAYLFFFFF